jgi:alkylation response protein AidB-like acyl-CoA dehydrogenase
MTTPTGDVFSDSTAAVLEALADEVDSSPAWPTASWEALGTAGVFGWSIPTQYGGLELDGRTLLRGYEWIAAACLTTAFLLSQRDAAVRRIRDTGRADLCRELLRPLACGGRFATVGLSQLTTSRQFGGPALRAEAVGDRFILNGSMPWVTGAQEADHLVTGAALDDGQQVMLVLPTDAAGLRIGPPLDLMALRGSLTTEVRCEGVAVDRQWLLAGPAERVMNVGRGGTGGLETSALALGLAKAAIDHVHREAAARPEWNDLAARLESDRRAAHDEMNRLAGGGGTPEAALALRAAANALVLRATQAALTVSKGDGFVHPHPAQRWARQALFFLVWSCPRPAAEATLGILFGECDG